MDEFSSFLSLVSLAAEKCLLRRVVFSKPQGGVEAMRVGGRLCQKGNDVILSLEYAYPTGRVSHQNVAPADIPTALLSLCESYDRINLLTQLGDADICRSKKGKLSQNGVRALLSRIEGENTAANEISVESLDKKKNHLLNGDESFLKALGITDKSGRIHDKKQAKFRQINRFLEHLRDVYPFLPKEGELLVYDLCCGKSYLSFAVYHYLSVMMGRKVRMLGIDLKYDVIDYCNEVARAAGFDGMQFVADDIRNTKKDEKPDLVISLHACDIATDIVLSQAVTLGASVILSTPCCHRYVKDRISAGQLAFVTRHGQLSQKLCESLTDGLRLLFLAKEGYTATALELTDPDDTPKNTLLRAVKNPRFLPDSKDAVRRKEEYRAALSFLFGEDGAESYLSDL